MAEDNGAVDKKVEEAAKKENIIPPQEGDSEEERNKKWKALTKKQKDEVVSDIDGEPGNTKQEVAKRWNITTAVIDNRLSGMRRDKKSPASGSKGNSSTSKRAPATSRTVVIHDLKPLRKKVAALLNEIDSMIAAEGGS